MEFLVAYLVSVIFSHTTSVAVNRRMRIDLAKMGYKLNYKLYNLNQINKGFYNKNRTLPYSFPINIYESIKLMSDYLIDPNIILKDIWKYGQIIELSSTEKETLEKSNYNFNSILKMSSASKIVYVSEEFVDDLRSELLYKIIGENATDEELFNICIEKINKLHPGISIDSNNPAFQTSIYNVIKIFRLEAKPFCKYNIYDREGDLVVEKKYSDEEAKIIIYPVLEDIVDALNRLDSYFKDNENKNKPMQDKINEFIVNINRKDLAYDEIEIILYNLIMKWYPEYEEIDITEEDLDMFVGQIENAIREVNFYDQKESLNEGCTYTKKHK